MTRKQDWNTGPTGKRDPRIIPGFKGDVAQVYVVILQLFYYHLRNEEFSIITEESEMGALDDVVVRTEKGGQQIITCYQVKHGASLDESENVYRPADWYSGKSDKGIQVYKLFYGWCLAKAKAKEEARAKKKKVKVRPILFSNNILSSTINDHSMVNSKNQHFTSNFVYDRGLKGKTKEVRNNITSTIAALIGKLDKEAKTKQEREENEIVKAYISQRNGNGTDQGALIKEFLSEMEVKLRQDNYAQMQEDIERTIRKFFDSNNLALFPFLYKEIETWMFESPRMITNDSVTKLFAQTKIQVILIERWLNQTELQLKHIDTTLKDSRGEVIHLSTEEEIGLSDTLTQSGSRYIVLSGPHGAGKSALVKTVLEKNYNQEVLWIPADELASYKEISKNIRHIRHQISCIVIDSAETSCIYEDQLQSLKSFFKKLIKFNQQSQAPIKLIFTVCNTHTRELLTMMAECSPSKKLDIETISITGLSDELIEEKFPGIYKLREESYYPHLKNPWLLNQFLQLLESKKDFASKQIDFDNLAQEVLNFRLRQACQHTGFDSQLIYQQCFRLLKKMVVAENQRESILAYNDDIVVKLLFQLGLINITSDDKSEFVAPTFKHDIARQYAIYLYLSDKFHLLVDIDHDPVQFLIESARNPLWAAQAINFGRHIAVYLKGYTADEEGEEPEPYHIIIFYMLLDSICRKAITDFAYLLKTLPSLFLNQTFYAIKGIMSKRGNFNLETFIVCYGDYQQLDILLHYKQEVVDSVSYSLLAWPISQTFRINPMHDSEDLTYEDFDMFNDDDSSISEEEMEDFDDCYYKKPEKYSLSTLRDDNRYQKYMFSNLGELNALFRGTKASRLHNQYEDTISARESQDNNLLPMLTAIDEGNFRATYTLVHNNKDYRHERNAYRETPLHKLCLTQTYEKERMELIYFLAKQKANLNAIDLDGETPLHNAVYENNLHIVQLLLELGANPNCQNTVNFTPLHIATANRSTEMVNLLLAYGADSEKVDCKKYTSLQYLVESDYKFACALDEAEEQEEYSDTSQYEEYRVEFEICRHLEAVSHSKRDYCLAFLKQQEKSDKTKQETEELTEVKQVKDVHIFSSGLRVGSSRQLNYSPTHLSMSDQLIFMPLISTRRMIAEGDGNCCFNVAILGLFKLILTVKTLPKQIIDAINHWLTNYYKKINDFKTLKHWIIINKNNYQLWQHTFATSLRACTVDLIKKSPTEKETYTVHLINAFKADFMPLFEEKFSLTESPKINKERIRAVIQKNGLDDTFISHDFILDKMFNIAKEEESIETKSHLLKTWWQTAGWPKYLVELQKPASSSFDIARWGGSNELTLIALNFGLCFQYYKNEGYEYLGSHLGTIKPGLNETQLKSLSDRDVILPCKGQHLINPLIQSKEELLARMDSDNDYSDKPAPETARLVINCFCRQTGLMIQLKHTIGHWEIIDAMCTSAQRRRQYDVDRPLKGSRFLNNSESLFSTSDDISEDEFFGKENDSESRYSGLTKNEPSFS